jgi:3-phosphoglycerate kinase
MSYTFLAAQGYEVGQSLLEADKIPQVSALIEEAAGRGVELVLPVDIVTADRFAPDADQLVVAADAIPADREGMDMGPATRTLIAQKLADAKGSSSSPGSPPEPGRWPRRSAGSAA